MQPLALAMRPNATPLMRLGPTSLRDVKWANASTAKRGPSNPIHTPRTSLDDRYVWGLVGKNRIYFDGFKVS